MPHIRMCFALVTGLCVTACSGPAALSRRDGYLAIPSVRERVTGVGSQSSATAVVVAGTGQAGLQDGPLAQAAFNSPAGLLALPNGDVVIADDRNHSIRRWSSSGVVTTLAGNGEAGFRDGRGAAARFREPVALALAPDQAIWVADDGNHAIRRIDATGTVTTIAGDGKAGNQNGRAARFHYPSGIAFLPDGRAVVCDNNNHRLRAIASDGTVSDFAGIGMPGYRDGEAREAAFSYPTGVATGPDGSLYVSDPGNFAIRRIAPDGMVTTILRGREAPAEPNVPISPFAIAIGPSGDVLVSDLATQQVLRWRPDATVSVLDRQKQLEGRPAGLAFVPPATLIVGLADRHTLLRLELD